MVRSRKSMRYISGALKGYETAGRGHPNALAIADGLRRLLE
jgi:hypothetical protein